MTNTELLEDRITKSGLKKNFIADKLGLSMYGFSLKLKNKSQFKANEIAMLCELLCIENEDVCNIFFAK